MTPPSTASTPTPVQEVFDGPLEQHDVPEYVSALLTYLAHEITRVESNRRQREVSAPTGWSTSAADYTTSVFAMRGYRYPETEEDTTPPNFEARVNDIGHIILRWYKHLGTGMTCNRELAPDLWVTVFEACLESVRENPPAQK